MFGILKECDLKKKEAFEIKKKKKKIQASKSSRLNELVDECLFLFGPHNGVLKYVTCTPPLHAGNRIEDPGGQGSVGDRLGSVASTFLVGDSGFSGACVTQLSATAATAMLREGSGKQRAVTSESQRKIDQQGGGRGEEETESSGRGKSLCASFVLKSIPGR